MSTRIPDPSRSAVVITGATSGIGLATAQRVVADGHAVFIVGRDPDRLAAALTATRSVSSGGTAYPFLADLSSQTDIRKLAVQLNGALADTECALDAIVHSAGVYLSRRTVTVDGIEQTFAVNHLAPFLLTHELLELTEPDAPIRVVVVGSHSHHGARLDLDHIDNPRRYHGLAAYRSSKLANELYVRALATRLEHPDSSAYSVDPVLVDTAIGQKNSGPASKTIWRARRRLGTSAHEPAETIAALATGAIGHGHTGTTWRDHQRIAPSTNALDAGLADELWDRSRELCLVAGMDDGASRPSSA